MSIDEFNQLPSEPPIRNGIKPLDLSGINGSSSPTAVKPDVVIDVNPNSSRHDDSGSGRRRKHHRHHSKSRRHRRNKSRGGGDGGDDENAGGGNSGRRHRRHRRHHSKNHTPRTPRTPKTPGRRTPRSSRRTGAVTPHTIARFEEENLQRQAQKQMAKRLAAQPVFGREARQQQIEYVEAQVGVQGKKRNVENWAAMVYARAGVHVEVDDATKRADAGGRGAAGTGGGGEHLRDWYVDDGYNGKCSLIEPLPIVVDLLEAACDDDRTALSRYMEASMFDIASYPCADLEWSLIEAYAERYTGITLFDEHDDHHLNPMGIIDRIAESRIHKKHTILGLWELCIRLAEYQWGDLLKNKRLAVCGLQLLHDNADLSSCPKSTVFQAVTTALNTITVDMQRERNGRLMDISNAPFDENGDHCVKAASAEDGFSYLWSDVMQTDYVGGDDFDLLPDRDDDGDGGAQEPPDTSRSDRQKEVMDAQEKRWLSMKLEAQKAKRKPSRKPSRKTPLTTPGAITVTMMTEEDHEAMQMPGVVGDDVDGSDGVDTDITSTPPVVDYERKYDSPRESTSVEHHVVDTADDSHHKKAKKSKKKKKRKHRRHRSKVRASVTTTTGEHVIEMGTLGDDTGAGLPPSPRHGDTDEIV